MTAVPFTEIMKTFKFLINQKLIRPKVNVLFGYCNTRLLYLAFPLGGRWTDCKVRTDEGKLINPLITASRSFSAKEKPIM